MNPFEGAPTTPTNPSRGLSVVEKMALTYGLRRALEMSALKGWKTYLCMTVLIVASGLKATGYIDEATYAMIVGVVAPAGGMALRAGMKASAPVAPPAP